jgi:hypothetical protein
MIENIETDILIVGSGCTGVIAAMSLAGSGKRVMLLDPGVGPENAPRFPEEGTFEKIRLSEADQLKLFLGNNGSFFFQESLGTGAQFTSSRKFISEKTDELIPYRSKNFSPMESLATGGLGEGWGLGCCIFSDAEIQACGISPDGFKEHYQWVADRIGISGAKDDAEPFTASALDNIMPAFPTDATNSRLLASYNLRKEKLNRNGFFLGRPSLALTTEKFNNRGPYTGRDLDFYLNENQSAWRPSVEIPRLVSEKNIIHKRGLLVKYFHESESGVEVFARDIKNNTAVSVSCQRLILATGPLGNARIVAATLAPDKEIDFPMLCNPYYYLSFLNMGRLGKSPGEVKTGLAQLSLFHDQSATEPDIAMASIYSYNSLMFYRVVKELPLAMKNSIPVLRSLLPAMSIAGVHLPADNSIGGTMKVRGSLSESPTVEYNYPLNSLIKQNHLLRIKKFRKAISSLGVWPLGISDPGMGSSIHYAGTLPMGKTEKYLGIDRSGKLAGSNRVFVADGSGFNYLPAKGITFTLMAWARKVALNV